MLLTACDHVDLASPMSDDLDCKMGRGAETIQSDPSTGLYLAQPQGPVTNHACAKQWCCIDVGESSRQGISEILMNSHILGVSSVDMESGEPGVVAQVLSA